MSDKKYDPNDVDVFIGGERFIPKPTPQLDAQYCIESYLNKVVNKAVKLAMIENVKLPISEEGAEMLIKYLKQVIMEGNDDC